MRPLIILSFVVLLPLACAAQSPTLRSVLTIVGKTDSTFGFSLERLRVTEATVLRGAFVEEMSVEGAGYTSRGLADGFLLSVSNTLRPEWLQTFGGPGYDAITCMQPLRDGGLVVGMLCGAGTDGITTYRVGDVTFTGRGGADAVVFVVNADGSVRWVRNDGAINAEYPTSITVVDDSLIVVAGIFTQRSRFGSENVADSAEISGYVQAISLTGVHQWVRVVRGISVTGNSNSVQIDVRHAHASSGRIGVVAQSTESIRWGDSTLAVGTDLQKRTTAIVYADVQGNPIGIDSVATCIAEQTVFGSFRTNISAAASETAADACIPFPVDAITWRADVRSVETQRSLVSAPHVVRTRDVPGASVGETHAFVSGGTDAKPLLLALDDKGNERWRYIHPAIGGGLMYDALHNNGSVTAIARSTSIELLSLGLTSGIDNSERERAGFDGSDFDDANEVDDANVVYEAAVVYNDELRALRAIGYTLITLTGTSVTESESSSPLSQTLAPQVCILIHSAKPSRVVLYFCR